MLNFVIVGAQKSASSLIHKILLGHPDVEMPKAEIPVFEDPEYEDFSKDLLRSLFTSSASLKGIKRPTLLHLDYVPGRIKEQCPDAKIIISLRNPVSRVISAYYHYMRFGFIPVEDVNIGLRKLMSNEYAHNWKRAHEILGFSFYASALKSYISIFGKENVHISLMEDVVKDVDSYSVSLSHFLNIENVQPVKTKANPGKYSLSRLRYLQFANRFFYKYNQDVTRVYERERGGRRFFGCLLMGVDKFGLNYLFKPEFPKLTDELTAALCEYYIDDVNECERILGVDLNFWKI